MSAWTKLRDSIEDFFTHHIWTWFKPFVDSIEHGGGALLITAAENAVAAGFSADGDGNAKMAAALASFTEEITSKGMPFIESQARALIEVALQKAKAAV